METKRTSVKFAKVRNYANTTNNDVIAWNVGDLACVNTEKLEIPVYYVVDHESVFMESKNVTVGSVMDRHIANTIGKEKHASSVRLTTHVMCANPNMFLKTTGIILSVPGVTFLHTLERRLQGTTKRKKLI